MLRKRSNIFYAMQFTTGRYGAKSIKYLLIMVILEIYILCTDSVYRGAGKKATDKSNIANNA